MQIIKTFHRQIATTTLDLGDYRAIVYKKGSTYSLEVGNYDPSKFGPDCLTQLHGIKKKTDALKWVSAWLERMNKK